MRKISKKQSGFSALDPLFVTLLVGASSLAVIDNFTETEYEAMTAAVSVMATNITNAATQNAVLASNNMGKFVSIDKCSDVPSLYIDGLPKGYSVTGPNIVAGERVMCDVNYTYGDVVFTHQAKVKGVGF